MVSKLRYQYKRRTTRKRRAHAQHSGSLQGANAQIKSLFSWTGNYRAVTLNMVVSTQGAAVDFKLKYLMFFFKKMLSGSSHYPVKLIGQKDVVIEFSVFGTHGNIPCLNCKKDSGRIFSTNI